MLGLFERRDGESAVEKVIRQAASMLQIKESETLSPRERAKLAAADAVLVATIGR